MQLAGPLATPQLLIKAKGVLVFVNPPGGGASVQCSARTTVAAQSA